MAADSGSPKTGGGGAHLNVHPLVKKLMGDDGEPTNAVSLVGYVGPSKKAEHIRLYTGLDFQSYYEVPRASVLDAQAVDAEDENSASTVMIHPDATLELVQTTKQSGTASFLAGGIAGAFLTSQGQAAILHPTTTIFTRPSVFVICPSRELICRSTGLICQHTLIRILCEGIPGGTVGEEAAAVQAPNAPSLFCASFNIPCHSRPQHCPVANVPPEQVQAAIAPSVLCNSVNIPCRTNFGGHCPTHFPCFVTRAPEEAQAAPAAIHATSAGLACTMPLHICTRPGLCGTNLHMLC
jgi:hypothetical protein